MSRPWLVTVSMVWTGGLVACGGVAAERDAGEVRPVSIPAEEQAVVYQVRGPDIDYPELIDRMADAFGIPESQEREWVDADLDDRDVGAIGHGGAGDDADGDGAGELGLRAINGTPSWNFGTEYWQTVEPFCDGCPLLGDFTAAEAVERTYELMSELGFDPEAMAWAEPRVSDTDIRVRGNPLFEGGAVVDQVWTFVFGPGGELYFAAGYVAEYVPVGVVRSLSPDEVLAAQPAGRYDPSVPLERVWRTVRSGPDFFLYPGYLVTTVGGSQVSVSGVDRDVGMQPLPGSAPTSTG